MIRACSTERLKYDRKRVITMKKSFVIVAAIVLCILTVCSSVAQIIESEAMAAEVKSTETASVTQEAAATKIDELNLLENSGEEDASATDMSGEDVIYNTDSEVIGRYDRDYWEEVIRELGSFAEPTDIEVFVGTLFDETIREDTYPHGQLTFEDYIYSTDAWRFHYNEGTLAGASTASITLRDTDGRTLKIMDDADGMMIEETDGSITWVTMQSGLDCADMIRNLLPWARGEYPAEEELRAEGEAAAEAALAELGYYGLPDLEPVDMTSGETTTFWADQSELPTGPYVTLFYGTDDLSVDLRYERMYKDDAHTRPLGAEAYEKCRSFFAASETVADIPLDSLRGFVTDGSVYYGPRIVWYDEENDLLFSMIAFHFDGGQALGSYTTEELIVLAKSVSEQSRFMETPSEIPEEIQSFLGSYLKALQEGPEIAVDYMYFLPENASHYEYFRESGNKLVEYIIRDSVMINSKLYAFLISYDTQASKEGYIPISTAWTYVANIDGEYTILNSSNNIPDSIKDNFVEEDFVVPEEYEMIPEDAIVPEEDIIR